METDNVTLTYLTNPIYNLERKAQLVKEKEHSISRNEIQFYRKRINALSRNLIKGEVVNDNVKAAHDEYIKVAIDYLKLTDTEELIQNEYHGCDYRVNPTNDDVNFDIDQANNYIISKKEPSHTLDSYVTIKRVNTGQTDKKVKHPQRRNLDLHSSGLRLKGVKCKKKENINT